MQTMRTIVWFALLGCGAAATAAATDGLDPHFGSGGVMLIGTSPVGGHTLARAHGVAVQPDGKLLIATATDGMTVEPEPQPTEVPAIVRLNADGSWDESFGDSGLYRFPGSETASTWGGEARSVAVTSDGAIIVAGETYKLPFGDHDVHSCTLLFKVDANGTLDTTFGNGGSLCFDFAPEPVSTNVQHDASLAISSGDLFYLTTSQTNLDYGAVARFTPDGMLDASYGSGGIAAAADGTAFELLALQPDQRLLATGGAVTYRFTESGAPDPTFGVGGEIQVDFDPFPSSVYAQSAMLDREGRLLTGLQYSTGLSGDLPMSRIGPDGTLDTTFNGANQQPGFPGFAAPPVESDDDPFLVYAAPAEDHIFAVGVLTSVGTTESSILLARLADDASFDTSYGDATHPGWTGLQVAHDGNSQNEPHGVAMDPAGGILIMAYFVGDTVGRCNGIVRIIPDDLFSAELDPPPAHVCPP